MKTLYVSDLDGTLLRSDETISAYTCSVIRALTEKGMLFSYATARSFVTAKKVTKGLEARIPVIVYNGTFVVDNVTGHILIKNDFDSSVLGVLDDLFEHGVYPIVYSFINGKEKFSVVPELCTEGMKKFLRTRTGDVRTNAVKTLSELKKGDIFYITCIDTPEKLRPLYEKYRDMYHCIYDKDLYSREQWLEIMPLAASKSNAVRQLKELLGCERLTVFGDGKNDMDMFQLAEESYAVDNADAELKQCATDVILSNDEDAVAKWLELHYDNPD